LATQFYSENNAESIDVLHDRATIFWTKIL